MIEATYKGKVDLGLGPQRDRSPSPTQRGSGQQRVKIQLRAHVFRQTGSRGRQFKMVHVFRLSKPTVSDTSNFPETMTNPGSSIQMPKTISRTTAKSKSVEIKHVTANQLCTNSCSTKIFASAQSNFLIFQKYFTPSQLITAKYFTLFLRYFRPIVLKKYFVGLSVLKYLSCFSFTTQMNMFQSLLDFTEVRMLKLQYESFFVL